MTKYFDFNVCETGEAANESPELGKVRCHFSFAIHICTYFAVPLPNRSRVHV